MGLSPKEREWLEELFDTYYDKVYAFLYARTGNTALAEDLASQTFVKIAENHHTYRKEKGALSTWIFTIALNEIRSHFRRQKGKETAALDDLPELPGSEDTESEYIQDETRRELFSLLRGLDERQRNVVTLKYYGGLSGREIGKLVGLSESNVSTILNRAIKKLKNLMERCDETPEYAYKNREGKS